VQVQGGFLAGRSGGEGLAAVCWVAKPSLPYPSHIRSANQMKLCMPRSRGGGLSFEDDGQGFSRPQPVAPPAQRRRSWLTSGGGGGTPSLSGERGGDSHAGTSGSVSEEGSEGGAPPPAAPPPPKKRRRPGAEATTAMALASRLDRPLLRAAGPLTGSTAFDGKYSVDGVSQLPADEDLLPLPRPLTTCLFLPEAAGIGKRQASLSGWLPDRARSLAVGCCALCVYEAACASATCTVDPKHHYRACKCSSPPSLLHCLLVPRSLF